MALLAQSTLPPLIQTSLTDKHGVTLDLHISIKDKPVLNLTEGQYGEEFISYELDLEDMNYLISTLKQLKKEYVKIMYRDNIEE